MVFRTSALICAVLLYAAATAAQDVARPCPTTCRPDLLARRTLQATAIGRDPAPTIDGRLDEAVWARAGVAAGFVQSRPSPGAAASLPSEARVLADGQALYIALTYDDPAPDTIVAPLARRDDETTADWAFVEIDSRHDRRSGFSFGVNPRGVQVDGLWVSDTSYDPSWNAVWEAAARMTPHGWTAEFRIPFSQLQFVLPGDDRALVWGINFFRSSPHHGESSNWSPRYPGLAGIVSNFNDLLVPPPATVRRVEVTPYATPRASNGPGSAFSAGADLRVGLGASLTMTATVHPDFGQVEADPSQVNLTALELFQRERRPFFLEGLDIFRFDSGLSFTTRDGTFANDTAFYSRRVGRPLTDVPAGLSDRAQALPILAAAKLAGQTAGGWSAGTFSALTDATATEARQLTTVGRLRRSLDRSGSFVGLYGAAFQRLAPSADVARARISSQLLGGADGLLRFADNRYEAAGWTLVSRTAGSEDAIDRLVRGPVHLFQRPDSGLLSHPIGRALTGAAGEGRVSRVGGSLRWDASVRATTPGFDDNEIGFESTADWLVVAGKWKYERFRPGRLVRAWTIGSDNSGSAWTWSGTPRGRVASAYGSIDWRSYWTTMLTATHDSETLSTTWLRGGPSLRLPARDTLAVTVITDQRRASYASVDATAAQDRQLSGWSATFNPLVNVRSSDRVQWSVGPLYRIDAVPWQTVTTAPSLEAPAWAVARLDQRTLSLTARADVVFSPRMSLQLYAQPFASVGRYDRPQLVVAPRAFDIRSRVAPLDPALFPVVDVASSTDRRFNGNAVFRWEYRPGSFVTLVWNQVRTGQTDTLRLACARSGQAASTTGGALGRVFRDPATNVLMVKISFRAAL